MRKGLEDRVLWASMNNASGIGAEGEALASCHLPGDDSWQGKYQLVRERPIEVVMGNCCFTYYETCSQTSPLLPIKAGMREGQLVPSQQVQVLKTL